MKKRRSNFSDSWVEEEVQDEISPEKTPKTKKVCLENGKTCSAKKEKQLKKITNNRHTNGNVEIDENHSLNSENNSENDVAFKEETNLQKNESDSETNEANSEDLEENNGNIAEECVKNQEDDEKSNDKPKKKKHKKRKKGLIYVSNLPKHMNVTRIREYLGQYGNIGRVYLQPDRTAMCRSKKRKNMARHFSEGWIEFLSKTIAKQVAAKLNNTQIGTRKKSKFYDSLWCMKYLPSFKWVHLSERLAYEQAVYKKRLMAEISQARKETDFFQQNLDKSESIKKLEKKKNKKNKT